MKMIKLKFSLMGKEQTKDLANSENHFLKSVSPVKRRPGNIPPKKK
jgi:hypothetical protein